MQEFRHRWLPKRVLCLILAVPSACSGDIGGGAGGESPLASSGGRGGHFSAGGAGGDGGAVEPVSGVCATDNSVPSKLPRRLIRLSNVQYTNVLREVLGNPKFALQTSLPETDRRDGYRNHPETLLVNDELVANQFVGAGLEVADAVLATLGAHQQRWGVCSEATPACHVDTLLAIAERAFRRPLMADEALRIKAAHAALVAKADVKAALRFAIAYVLNAPQTLYRTEGLLAWSAPAETPAPFEIADLVAFTLTNKPADPALAADARSDALDAARVAHHVERLLTAGERLEGLHEFVHDWLDTNDLPVEMLTTGLKNVPTDLSARLRTQIGTTFQALVARPDATVTDLFGTTTVALDRRLATFYGVDCPTCTDEPTLVGQSGQAGLLGLPGYLMAHGRSSKAQPIYRGVHVARRILCFNVGDPVGIDIDRAVAEAMIPEDADSRAFVEAATRPAACMACHANFNGIGFVMEAYDSLGRLRTDFKAAPAAMGPELGDAEASSFEGFTQLLARSDTVHACAEKHLMAYASQFALQNCGTGKAQARTLRETVQTALLTVAFAPR